MIRVNGRMAGSGDAVQPLCFDILEQEFHLPMEGWMIVLEGQDVIGSLLSNRLGNLFLTPHGVDRDNGTLQLQHPQQRGNGGDFVRLVIDFALPSYQPMGISPRADHVDSPLRGGMIKGAAQRFSIDRDDIPVE
jgi:hypothetical protein